MGIQVVETILLHNPDDQIVLAQNDDGIEYTKTVNWSKTVHVYNRK